jgi:hypothetical protein
MTTKKIDKLKAKNDVRSSSLPPPLYKIQYPNCRTGMFSLRAPFKDFNTNERQQQQQQQQQPLYTRSLTPNIAHPKYLHADQSTFFIFLYIQISQYNLLVSEQERPVYQQSSQRDVQVQCSLPTPPVSRDGVAIRRQQTFVTQPYNRDALSPHYRVQLQLQPAQPNIYEVWDVETPPPRTIPINEPIRRREPSIRVRSSRLVNIKSFSDDSDDDDDESDYDDTILYARYPSRTYLPSNVRMVCVRQDANTIAY